ncbi:TonB-dependent receptor [Ramlibacter sp.]|uniref:TonB-dependent receptor n=1 Tax=Ramlibacter sp. TaxID=1917967 RepID=UPI0035B13BA8
MRKHRLAAALAAAFPFACAVHAQAVPGPTRDLGIVTITGGQPTSLPTQVTTTMEGITRTEIERAINATDSEDALKYFPSLLVRKRYIGDYNHAILSSRASGTGNSARSAVYADGILLSNYLGNGVGGLSFPPRWGLVTPEEIDRVDVMYGPFSAAYPGNSVGAVVDYVTRMPTRLEGHVRVGYVVQPFELYGTNETYRSWQASASVGSKSGDWSYWINVNRTDSEGQPLGFASRTVSTGTVGTSGTAVTGAVPERNTANAPIYYIGHSTQYHTIQDHAKIKLAYDFSPTVRAAYTFGSWQNTSTNRPQSYLRNASGAVVTSGAININGASFGAVTGGDLPLTEEKLTHFMHGFSVKSRTQGLFDWEVSASLYDYDRDHKRQNAGGNTLPGAATGGAGTLADGSGTGWQTLALRGTWRPGGEKGAHIVDFGWQHAGYKLDYLTSSITGNWLADAPGAVSSDVGGRTRLQALWAQDVWRLAPTWKAVLGGRLERWTASEGRTRIPGATPAINTAWPDRTETSFSPKAALSWQWRPDTVLKASLGRAVRYPTVGELYGATSTVNSQSINDPNLKPEKSWTAELSAERELGNGLARLTFFAENTRDALYSQTTFDPLANRNVSRVQNVGRIATQGLEAAFNAQDVSLKGLDLQASVTYAHSIIKENAGFVSVPGDTVGKRQPNIPRWRASALASYRWNDAFSTSVGARYSGQQFRTLDNADVNGFTYFGVSRFFVVDLRAQWKISKTVTGAFGIDNVGNDKYWNFHPYPQRSYVAELKADF